MKKTIYLLPALVMLLLQSCYVSDYVLENRMLGDIKTETATINENRHTLSLRGSVDGMEAGDLHFQLCRTRDFTEGETREISYKEGQDIPLGMLSGTYFYRLFATLESDTIYANDVQTFSVDNSLSILNPESIDATSYKLTCMSNQSESIYFQVSKDNSFSDYTVYEANESNYDNQTNMSGYTLILNNLSRGTTYYVKAIRNVLLGTIESVAVAFTTAHYLRIGDLTYTDWDGKKYPLSNVTSWFLLNYVYGNEIIARNIDGVYFDGHWGFMQPIEPMGTGLLYACCSKGMNKNNSTEIEIQTYKYDDPYLLWGMTKEYNEVFDINFRNMLSRVVLHIGLTDDYPEDKPIAHSLTISGTTLPTAVTFDVINGNFSYGKYSYSEPLGYWHDISLVKGESIELVLYSIPCDNGTASLTLNFDNNRCESEMEIGWQSGKSYDYTVSLSANSLSVSDVTVNPWQPEEGGSIIINPNK